MKIDTTKSIFCLFAGLWIFYGFGLQTVGIRLGTELNGTIIQSVDQPSTNAPRYSTNYIFQDADGHTSTYIAGPTDAYLPRSMPIGTKIRKQKWHLSYEKDGQTINDFSVIFYSITLAIGFLCLCLSFYFWRRNKRL